ncbi:MAG: PhoX family phosphatase [Phycisphaerales bacterium]|nr:PhoX family phosphatase [Phycisphaerales bacterium]
MKAALAAVASAMPNVSVPASSNSNAAQPSSLTFAEIQHGLDGTHHLPAGYTAQVLVRFGDPLFGATPAFAPGKADAQAQERQFGADNDFLAFMPLPSAGDVDQRGLLCANHERSTAALMWRNMASQRAQADRSAAQCAHEMSAQGMSIVEVRQRHGRWELVRNSAYNRRITARTTRMTVGGPAAGHPRMRTRDDPSGRQVIGTLNNCAGGVTPWGTILTCEENIHFYFLGDPAQHPEAAALRRYGFGGRLFYAWGRHVDRFHLQKEANEPNRFGWVVEVDPYDPKSVPVKRTALGRFKHEGATTAISHDGRVVVYLGDDERFEYLYKFVSEGRYDAMNRVANRDLLERGTLYVARFEAERMHWLPLVHGEGPLTAANGFRSQADVVIEARRAADLVGATSMDRPEDVEPHPHTGNVYVVLTNNHRRDAHRLNSANPRPDNRWGQILEIVPPRVNGAVDHTAFECGWEFFLLAGDPEDARQSARYAGPVSRNGWLACPDNIAFDREGRIWIATDGQTEAAGFADSLYAADTNGPGRGITRLFFNAPRGAEVCGPCFSPDGRTLFIAVQHPAAERGSTFETPSTRWPDFDAERPPRSAVIAVTRADGGEIGR